MKFFKHNWKLKLIALLLAMLLEFYFYSPDNSVTKVLHASVSVRNVPPSMMVFSPDFPGERIDLSVTVRGPAPIVKQLEHEDIVYTVNYPISLPANYTETLKREEMRFALGVSGVDVLQVEPSNIDFVAERLLRKQLVVQATTQGEVDKAYFVRDLVARPTSVFVSGPKSKLQGINTVKTQPVDIGGLTATKRFEMPLARIGNWVRYNVDVVNVEVLVEQKEKPKEEVEKELKASGEANG